MLSLFCFALMRVGGGYVILEKNCNDPKHRLNFFTTFYNLLILVLG